MLQDRPATLLFPATATPPDDPHSATDYLDTINYRCSACIHVVAAMHRDEHADERNKLVGQLQ